MSTRCTIKYNRPDDGPGFHLFRDAWDGPDDAVELELFGVEAEVSTNGYARLVIPSAMARELGLLPAAADVPAFGTLTTPDQVDAAFKAIDGVPLHTVSATPTAQREPDSGLTRKKEGEAC